MDKPEIKYSAYISVDTTELDEALKKANQLVETLEKASTLTDLLVGKSEIYFT